MTVKYITNLIEDHAPLLLQEDFDNSGLLVGDANLEVSGVLLSIDITEAVIEEAIEHKLNLIISHHPLIFRGLKQIIGKNEVQRCVAKAIKNDIAIYSSHTNMDNVLNGVSGRMAEKIGLKNLKILSQKPNSLVKLITFVPVNQASDIRKALFEVGAGHIGNYDECSFNTEGYGTFRAGDNTNPYVGEKAQQHREPETRLEVIVPKYLINNVVGALLTAHPYEEPAYDIIPLLNIWNTVGLGVVGELEREMDEIDFLYNLKEIFQLKTLKYTSLLNRKIKRIALCGGAGSEFLKDAIKAQADVFISGDFKYHDYFQAENHILIADIGHFESEQYTKDVFYEIITKKIPKFAVRISKVNTNPINYL